MTQETALTLPDGRVLQLWRSPDRDQPDNLRAWDAADLMVLTHLAEHPPPSGRRLVVGDGFGALALGLATEDGLVSWSDSVSAHEAARANAILNGVDPAGIDWLPMSSTAPSASVAVVKIPKEHRLLDHQLRVLAATLPPGTPVIGAGMARHIRSITVEAFESGVGPTTTTRAWRKARLVLSTVGVDRTDLVANDPVAGALGAGALGAGDVVASDVVASDVVAGDVVASDVVASDVVASDVGASDPVGDDAVTDDHASGQAAADQASQPHVPIEVTVAGQTLRLHPAPGVFGEQGLDDGTRLLLENLSVPAGVRDVVDLACGTGVVGLFLAARDPHLRVTFTDDSHLAVASARQAWRTATAVAGTPERTASFHAADGLSACGEASADLIVVNPPFHHGREISDAVAWAMLSDARRVLRPGGYLIAVGNRHLAYHAKLNRLYGGSEVLASDPRFVVLSALRR